MTFLSWFAHGVFDLPWWQYVVITLVLTHITIISVTIYLHRAMAHRAVELHPIISHFFRFWLWLTTGMVTKEWTAIHRKHHAFSDKEGDPHSPHVYGINRVLRAGAELYKVEAANQETMDKYGSGTPDDWIERNLYSRHSTLGIILMLITNISLFGVIGLSIWAVQMAWIPIFAAGVINGLGHWFGYRNFENPDKATNLIPIAFFIGGEELHNNHHTFATSAKFSVKWYEFDYGYMWIRLFGFFNLAKVRRTIPTLRRRLNSTQVQPVTDQTLETIIANRYRLAVEYSNSLKQECKAELAKLRTSLQNSPTWSRIKRLLTKDSELLTSSEQSTISQLCKSSQRLQQIFAMRDELSQLWRRSSHSKEQLLKSLEGWCKRAESSEIDNLRRFARGLTAIA